MGIVLDRLKPNAMKTLDSNTLFFQEIIGRVYRYSDNCGFTTNHGKRRTIMPVEYREETEILVIVISYTDSYMEMLAIRADKYCRDFFTDIVKPF